MPLGLRLNRTIATGIGSQYAPSVRAHALVELGDPEAIDLFLREEDAERALADALSDEPDWARLLYVALVELEENDVSPN
jgi:hypothetical protein